MKRFNLQQLSPLVGLILFVFALWVLNRALGENGYRQIFHHVAEFPAERILGAVGMTAASYGILTLYDHLALRYLGRSIGPVRVSLASYISYCFSRNIGFALLTGGSIRYRFYSAWGLSAEEIARLISFAAITFTLGLLTMGGSLLLVSPAPLPELSFPVGAFGPVGMAALALAGIYLLLVRLRRKPFRIFKWTFPLPTPRQALAQLAVGSLDWTLKASILYYLLSGVTPLSLPAFLEIYLLAQIVATVSHVPGGLGVFETVIVVLIPEIPAPDLLASLLVYRAVYFLLPFASAILLLGGLETLQQAKAFPRTRKYLDDWLSALAPPVFAAAVLISGAILLFSCATPTIAVRLEWLRGLVPLPLVELAHFLLALTGAGLLLLARGIQRRLQQAYVATLMLLTASIALTLLKGLTWEQAILLSLILAALIPSRELFYRQTPLREEVFPLGWVTILLIVFGSSLWLVSISYGPSALSLGRWGHFALADDAARSLRAMAGATTVLGLFWMFRVRRPPTPPAELPDWRALELAGHILARQPVAAGNLALLGDKRLLFTREEDAFLMYAFSDRFRVALGDPVGAAGQVSELAWCFRELCEHQRGIPLFYLVGQDHLPVYLDMGMALFKVGDDAGIALEAPPGEGRAEWKNKGPTGDWRFQVITDPASARRPFLQALDPEGLAGEEGGEAGFSQGYPDPTYLARFPMALLHCGEQPAACALILPGAEQTEITLDLLRFAPQFGLEAPTVLVTELLAWGRRAGYRRLSLGVVPAAVETLPEKARRWRGLGMRAFRNGRSFPSPQAMRDFAAGFQAQMSARYAAFPGEISPVDVFESIAMLIQATPQLRGRDAPRVAARYCDPE